MDVNGTEQVNIAALGGADTVNVGDLSGTGVAGVNVDLSGTGPGDGAADTVIVTGTNKADTIMAPASTGSNVTVQGLAAQVTVTGAEAANDTLAVNALGGDDVVTASAAPAGLIMLAVDGGAGNDKVLFFGTDQKESFDISANGSRDRLSRDIGNESVDLNATEQARTPHARRGGHRHGERPDRHRPEADRAGPPGIGRRTGRPARFDRRQRLSGRRFDRRRRRHRRASLSPAWRPRSPSSTRTRPSTA